MSTPTSIALSKSDEKLLRRLRGEERSRYHALGFFAAGAFFLWWGWDAPFAWHHFDSISSLERKDLPYAAIHNLPAWIVGVYWVCRGLYSSFFDRKRRLLVKLASLAAPEQSRNA